MNSIDGPECSHGHSLFHPQPCVSCDRDEAAAARPAPPQGRHYGIQAEPIEIKADLTPAEVVKTSLRRAGAMLVWNLKRLLRFRVR